MAAPTRISSDATAAFLVRCTRAPDRFFYPANAKARTPVCCVFQLNVAGTGQANVLLHECEYTQGGTGWRVWPCALLLACWIAANAPALCLPRCRVLELGCGLGLPGVASATFGAAQVDVTDCLPLLMDAVRRSIDGSGVSSRCRAALLDWDDEAPLRELGVADGEEYSTEQGVKAAQLEAAAGGGGAAGAGSGDAEPPGRLDASARFEILLASDVIYSQGHAAQLPLVVSRRLSAGGQMCAMVPVRSEAHTRIFLRGLLAQGMAVTLERVNADWVDATVALQRTEPPAGPRAGPPAALPPAQPCLSGGTERGCPALREGEILFVRAIAGAGSATADAATVEAPPSRHPLRPEPSV